MTRKKANPLVFNLVIKYNNNIMTKKVIKYNNNININTKFNLVIR